MSLTLFRKKRFAGESHSVTRSHGNLGVTPVGYRARSLTMNSPYDRALFFSEKMYFGKVAFVEGVHSVSNSARSFFKPIRAVRIDPFTLHLNVSLVRHGSDFPGSWANEEDALASVDAAINWVNRIWSGGLLWFERKKTEVHDSPRKFDLRWSWSGIPGDWRRPAMINVVFVNSLGRRGTVARPWPPLRGDSIVVGRVSGDREVSDDLLGFHLARSLTRHLGDTGRPPQDPRNLMSPGDPLSLDPTKIQLLPDQIERVHRALSANPGRRADRHN